MPRSKDVKPITYLKNSTAKLVREVTEQGRTVLITQNGEAKVVVMDVARYDRWRNAMAMAKLLSLSAAQGRGGRVVSTAEALARAEAVLLGSRSLEGLNLRIDPVTKRLIDAGPAPAALAVA